MHAFQDKFIFHHFSFCDYINFWGMAELHYLYKLLKSSKDKEYCEIAGLDFMSHASISSELALM